MSMSLLVIDEHRLPLSAERIRADRARVERWSSESPRAIVRVKSGARGELQRVHLEAVIEGLSSIAELMRERLRLTTLPVFAVPENLDVEILPVDSEAEAAAMARIDPHEISSGRRTRRGVIRIRVSSRCSAAGVKARARHELAHHLLRGIFDHPEWFGLDYPVADWIIAALEDDDDDASRWLDGSERIWRALPCRRTVRGTLNDVREALLDPRPETWSELYGVSLARVLEGIDGEDEAVVRARRVKAVERAIGSRLCGFVRQRADNHEHAASVLASLLEDFASYDRDGHPDPPFGEGDPRRSDTFFRSLVLHQSSQDPAIVRLSMAAHAFDLADRLGHRPAPRPIERLAGWTVAFRISEGPVLEIALPRNPPPPLRLATLERALGAKDEFLRAPLERAFAGADGHMPAAIFWARFLAAAEPELDISELAEPSRKPRFVILGGAGDFAVWEKERAAIAARFPRLEPWLPEVVAGTAEGAVATAVPSYDVFGAHLSAAGIADARRRAAEGSIHRALFRKNGALASAEPWDRIPASVGRPRDPRYRETEWALPEGRAAGSLPRDIFAAVEAETSGENGERKKRRLRTPLVHLLAAVRLGHGEKLR